MKKLQLSIFILLLSTTFSLAQGSRTSEEKDILKAVQQFFDAMEARDTTAFNSTSVDDRYTYFVQERNDSVLLGSRSAAQFSQRLAVSKNTVTEKMRDKEVKVEVHKRIAMVWAPYDLWINKNFSHCGVDVFTLLKAKEGWKIVTIAFSVEPEGCN